jgi:PII-like signaling protein
MLPVGPATKVTIYLNQDTGSERGFLRDEILGFLQEKGVGIGGATVLHPYAGFGSHGRLHKVDEGDVAGLHLPVVIFFVGTSEKVESILPSLLNMVTDGLVEVHPTKILKSIVGKEKVVS